MSVREPPALATWFLDQLGYAGQNPALIGDLAEEFLNGRSSAWYWRQALLVVVNGLGRNARASRLYLQALAVGFGAQAAVAFLLWRVGFPRQVHGAGGIGLASILVLAGHLGASVLKLRITGDWTANMRGLLCAGQSQARPGLVVLAGFEVFVDYLVSYCLRGLLIRRFLVGDLVLAEAEWLGFFALLPALVSVPPARNSGTRPGEFADPVHGNLWREFRLVVRCGDGREVELLLETAVETVFAAGDTDLARAIFAVGYRRRMCAAWSGWDVRETSGEPSASTS